MNERVANNILKFLERVSLTGSEAYALIEAVECLKKIKDQSPDDSN